MGDLGVIVGKVVGELAKSFCTGFFFATGVIAAARFMGVL